MTIKELMGQVDADKVTEAFVLVNWTFKPDNYEYTIAQKFRAISKMRDVIRANLEAFRTCIPNDATKECTVFIIENQTGENFENQKETDLSCYKVYDEEAISVLDKEFCIYTDDSEIHLPRYGFVYEDVCDIANYNIAKFSIEKLGKELCVAKIFSDMFFWGNYTGERKENMNSLKEQLNMSADKKEYVSLEEFEQHIRKLGDEIRQKMSDDERAYYFAKDKFTKEIKEIKRRYWKKVVRQVEKQHIAVIKEEYKTHIQLMEEEKDFIDEFIPSKDTRAYLHSIHHEFTDLEKATIVANHIMISYEEKVKWLNAFMNKISDAALKDRISKALIQIKKDRKYYRKCNMASGSLPDNESLFDFVFIPHDFRHGDIVRSLYGGWNTTEFCEKVGIILNYSDKDYEFYKNLKGDYSDVQVCVDIKFDGVAYQGEFEHEHINPIYIERMTLNEKDERRAYLNYLTNLYGKKAAMGESDNNKPEYVGGSDDLLEQRYLGKYIPVRDEATGSWCFQTQSYFERGDVGYIADVFSGTGLIYHFMHNGEMDHTHGFDGVLDAVLQDPEHVDIVTDYGEYSEQEIQMVKGIKRAVAFVQSHHRPMTSAELRENRAEAENKG